jgi:CheY-like chemotaxis protein
MADPTRQNELSIKTKLIGKKILVVDDNEYVCEMISKVLIKNMSLEVIKVKGGGQAIAAALTGQYDAAIIDLALQGTSSGKVIRAIKTMIPAFPILAMSAHPSDEQLASLKQQGIVRILHKPFKMTTLIEEINGLLGVVSTLSAQNK